MVRVLKNLLEFAVYYFQLFFVLDFKLSELLISFGRYFQRIIHNYNPYLSAKLLTLINLPFLILSSFSKYSFFASGSSSPWDSINSCTCLLMLIPCSLQNWENF